MKEEKRLMLAVAALAVAMLLWMGGTAALVWATLEDAERAAVSAALAPRMALVFMLFLVVLVLAALALRRGFNDFVAAPARLLEETQVLLATPVQRDMPVAGSAATQGLARAVNQLAAERAQLRGEIALKVAEASRGVEQERSRLAALMSELTQSVVVCNLDGRILLYNNRARFQLRALAQGPGAAQAAGSGAEWVGLGRSIYTVFDRKLVAHALENIQQRLQRGAGSPSAQFVTATRAGQLLRVQMAPVCEAAATAASAGSARVGGAAAVAAAAPAQAPASSISGFVLMLDNITGDFEAETARDQLLHGLTEGSRASLGNMQAAIEMLDYTDLEPAMRERFHGVIRDEVGAMSQRIRTLADDTAQGMKARWPLEDMLGADLVSAGLRRIEAIAGVRAAAAEVDAALWLKVDSFSLLQAVTYLAGRLADEYEIKLIQLRLQPAPNARAHLDLIWTGQAMSTETVMGWETDAMKVGQDSTSMTVRDVAQRHGGEFWFERERVRHQAFFRFLLPLASAQEALDAATFVRSDSRPEYYDFDLFKTSPQSSALDDRLLSELTYTVFDTETTGLDPSQGDEIIQIGAARIVNGKLLRSECFEQLVDPQRSIPAASIPIHGIQPEMVAGQPTIGKVLPVFHAFAQDTVLVAHNAAFDMRFLQLKEAATGVRFEQPVLDTLLLSAVVHPNQESHRLEAIAERLDVTVMGRHTAMGDAFVTAEVFLRLVPLLQARGIHTLGQARDAAQQTYLARVKY
jgi:DNA polymerase-3 subunit epsilon